MGCTAVVVVVLLAGGGLAGEGVLVGAVLVLLLALAGGLWAAGVWLAGGVVTCEAATEAPTPETLLIRAVLFSVSVLRFCFATLALITPHRRINC